jgi:hypothetical protein
MRHVLLTAVALILTMGSATGASGIPDKFRSTNRYRTSPLWISARAALNHGTLRPGAVEEHEAAALRNDVRRFESRRSSSLSAAAVPEGTCDVGYGALFDDAPMPTARNLDDVRSLASTESIVEGTVVDSEVGLYEGTPFTMVQVRVTPSGKAHRLDTAYLLIPKGTLYVDGIRVCTSDPRYVVLPTKGDTVLFVAGTPVDVDGTVFRIAAEHLFVWHGGALIVSPRLRSSMTHVATLPQLRQLLKTTTNDVR